MQTQDIRDVVLDSIAAVAPETDLGALRADLPLRRQIDLDSVDWINVVVDLCDRLSLDIPESDYAWLTTIDAIVAYAADHSARRKPPSPRACELSDSAMPHAVHAINGTRVTVRPMSPSDAAAEAEFVQNLSSESRYDRFMVTLRELPEAKLRYLTDVDQVRHVALVATVDRDGHDAIVGVVRYAVDTSATGCEFAIAIADAWQGSGLAGILMHALIDVARRRGLSTMEGSVLAINSRMLKFTRQLGFRQERSPADRDTVRVVKAL